MRDIELEKLSIPESSRLMDQIQLILNVFPLLCIVLQLHPHDQILRSQRHKFANEHNKIMSLHRNTKISIKRRNIEIKSNSIIYL